MTRRHLLASAAGAAGLAVAAGIRPLHAMQTAITGDAYELAPAKGIAEPGLGARNRAVVGVIGAGAAGLKVARELQAAGFSVIILEGRPRIGGRIFSTRLNGQVVERGAGWIHGVRGNPVAIFAANRRIQTHPTHWNDIALYRDDGKPYDHSEYLYVAKMVEEMYENLCDGKHPDGPLGPALRALVDAARADGRLNDEQYKIARWYMDSSVQGDVAEEIDRISISALSTYQALPGGDAAFPRGYGAVPGELAPGLDIRLATKVSTVDYSGRDIVVQTNAGKFTFQYVVDTVPVAVAKADAGPTYIPALPATKLAARQRIGVGLLDRVTLQFDHAFWPDRDVIGFDERKESSLYVNLNRINGTPTLVRLVTGDEARHMETLSDAEIVELSMQPLRKAFGDKIPKPKGVDITRWGKDEFARGSYSADAITVRAGDRKLLGAPVANRIFFCGEATHEHWSGTVHGAIDSAVRCAREIIATRKRMAEAG